MTEVEITITGIDDFIDALHNAPEIAEPLAEQAMARSLLAIQGRVAEYPPESEANRPRLAYTRPLVRGPDPNRWYERGYGTKWITRDGRVHGKKTSRFLGRQWAHEVQTRPDAILGVVGNSAPYADEVQGSRQKSYHAARGWLTLDHAVEQSVEDIEAAFGEAVEALLEALADS